MPDFRKDTGSINHIFISFKGILDNRGKNVKDKHESLKIQQRRVVIAD
jgi:hypothetical protein